MSDIFKPTSDEKPDFTEIKVEDLVGEGQKYQDANELAKAYANADWAIAQKDAQLAEAQARAKVLEDLLKGQGITPKTENRQEDNPEDQNKELREENKSEAPPVNPKDVDLNELVRQVINKDKEESRFSNNVNDVSERLASHFGDGAKARDYVNKKAKELGVGVDFLMDMAGRSPTAFMNTIGLNIQGGNRSTPVPSSDVHRSGNVRNTKNFKYFEEIRKANPKLYYAASTQREMFQARTELGDSFFN